MSAFSKRLRELRVEKNLTGEELGKIFNVTKTAISYWENSKTFPDELTLSKLADFFNVSLDYLLGKSDIRNPYVKYINEEQADYAVESDLNEYRQAKKFIDDLKEEMQKQGYDLNDKSIKEMSEILSLALKLADKTKSN